MNKLGEFKERVKEFDVVGIVESWASEQIGDAELALAGFNMFRRDRRCGKCGRVLLYIKESIKVSMEMPCSDNEFEEAIWCNADLGSSKLLIGICYRKPSSDDSNNEKLLEVMQWAVNQRRTDHVVIFGDFNYPEIDFGNCCVLSGQGKAAEKFFRTTQDLFLFQNVRETTRHRPGQEASTLDYVFTDEEGLIDVINYEAPIGKSDHVCLTWNMSLVMTEPVIDEHRLNFWKGDYGMISAEVLKVDWDSELASMNADAAWKTFEDKIATLTQKYVPKQIPRKAKRNDWITKDTVKTIGIRGKKWTAYRRKPTIENYAEYKKIRNKVTAMIKTDHDKFTERILSNCKSNPRKFYGYMNSLKTVKNRVGQLKRPDGKMTQTDEESANVLCNYFKSVFTNDACDQQTAKDRTDRTVMQEGTNQELSGIRFSYQQVRDRLLKLKMYKSPGPDGIHPMLLNNCADAVAAPLSVIFQKSFDERKVPDSWKLAIISPIYKKGSRSDPSNYRPVSLTSVCCKVMESIIKDDMISRLNKGKGITKCQHGFIAGRSCLTNLLEAFEAWTRLLEEGFGLDVIYLDYRKAFDTVSHRKLIEKIASLGFPQDLVDWIKSFLEQRRMKVKLGGSSSFWADVLSGVPQGSVLGPILFLIFVNDLPDWVVNDILMFADDTKIWAKISSLEDSKSLQDDLDKLVEWSKEWLLKFSPEKCKVMHVGHGRHTEYFLEDNGIAYKLQEVSSEKDLGVFTSSDLKSSLQCVKSAEKAMSVLRMVRRSFKNMNKENFLTVYKVYIRPHLEYAVQVWNPYLRKDIDVIEQIQHRATKMVKGLSNKSYPERLNILGLTTLEKRRTRGDLIEIYKIMTGKEGLDQQHFFQLAETGHSLRGHRMKLFKPRSVLNCRRHSFGQRVIDDWNALPHDVVDSTSVNMFKNRLDGYWEEENRCGQ